MNCCLAEMGSDFAIDTRTSVCSGRTEPACGEAECAVTQTVHLAASFALEWWCVTNATAEQSVSSRQSNAIRFENDRINDCSRGTLKRYTGNRSQSNHTVVTRITSVSYGRLRVILPRNERSSKREPVIFPGLNNRFPGLLEVNPLAMGKSGSD
jgi:Tfp pilus assembly protein FimT